MNEPKQVIVVRKDLNMRKGKIAAQVAHASMAIFSNMMEQIEDPVFDIVWYRFGLWKNGPVHKWWSTRFTKICVYVESEKELLDIYQAAKTEHILCSLITDSGLTEFNGVSTNTCVAIGPDESNRIDKITGHLKLL